MALVACGTSATRRPPDRIPSTAAACTRHARTTKTHAGNVLVAEYHRRTQTSWTSKTLNPEHYLTLSRGARVIVTGRLKQRSFTTREGDKRTVVELDVDEIGPSLRYATATVTRTTAATSGGPRTDRAVTGHRDGFGGPAADTSTGFGQPAGSPSRGEDPWREPVMAGAAAGFGDDAPPY
nr:single-stranded DNA-binding protein [Nocardia cerradoensis]